VVVDIVFDFVSDMFWFCWVAISYL